MRLPLLILMGLATTAHADLYLNKLFGVEIKTTKGTLSGYAVWSTEWLNENTAQTGSLYQPPPKEKTAFSDEELLERFRSEPKVMFVNGVAEVKYPVASVVATSPFKEIDHAVILSIVRSPKPHDGYTWYGTMNEFSPEVASNLQKPPVAQCQEKCDDDCLDTTFWFTYSKQVPPEKLKALCENPSTGPITPQSELEKKGIYSFTLSGD